MLYEFAVLDHSKGWVQQFHIGAIRNNNTGMFNKLGADTGFDSIADKLVAEDMSKIPKSPGNRRETYQNHSLQSKPCS